MLEEGEVGGENVKSQNGKHQKKRGNVTSLGSQYKNLEEGGAKRG